MKLHKSIEGTEAICCIAVDNENNFALSASELLRMVVCNDQIHRITAQLFTVIYIDSLLMHLTLSLEGAPLKTVTIAKHKSFHVLIT